MAALRLDFTLPLRDFELTLALDVARTVALVGPSGAGKTSVLRAIAGLAHPSAGRIELDDATWLDVERGIDLRPEERSVGLVFQEYALFPHLSVRGNVAYGGRERVDELLERFHIAHLAEVRPGTLSGGERQRVALARALAVDPDLILMDEPFSALDVRTREDLLELVLEIWEETGKTIVIVTHSPDEAALLADRVIVLGHPTGRVVADVENQFARPRDLGDTDLVDFRNELLATVRASQAQDRSD
jgi:ABC-type sulfate/molybdate transport systems ATPase subunit